MTTKMTKKSKLKKVLSILTTSDDLAEDSFATFENSVKKLQADLKTNITVKTIDEVNSKLATFKEESAKNLQPLFRALQGVRDDVEQRKVELENLLNEKSNALSEAQKSSDTKNQSNLVPLQQEIKNIKDKIAELSKPKEDKIPSVLQSIAQLEAKINLSILDQGKGIGQNIMSVSEAVKNVEKQKPEILKQIEEVRQEFNRRMGLLGSGGNANRQMFIGGNDPLKRYTDMNLKAGSNVTITYANNDQTKKVDVTFASTGGPGGSTRSITSVSTTTSAGDTAGTDYVYLCSGTFDITLPTAVGNTNLYTIKNVGSGIITIKTTSSQTIDGQATIVMPVQFTSVDLISDTANWNIT